MTRDQLKVLLSSRSPFEADELSEELLDAIIASSLDSVSFYLPPIKLGSTSVYNKNYKIGTDFDEFNNSYRRPVFEKWTFELVDNMPSTTKRFFEDFAVAFTYIYASNKRRSALVTELPFDLRGDNFYDQGMELKRQAEVSIQNNMSMVINSFL